MSIAENIARVRERIAAAARRAGRGPDQITLMAVSKTVEPERIRQAYEAGLRVFGENRVQEFEKKAPELRALSGARWHLIGHLQSNKARKAGELFDEVQSVDSLKIAQHLCVAALEANKTLPVLLEINIGREPAKSGFLPDDDQLFELLATSDRYGGIAIRGLMSIPPFNDDPQASRPYFVKLRELAENIRSREIADIKMDVLSMGMSHDFEVAIEEGSTCVRVGTAIFGERAKK